MAERRVTRSNSGRVRYATCGIDDNDGEKEPSEGGEDDDSGWEVGFLSLRIQKRLRMAVMTTHHFVSLAKCRPQGSEAGPVTWKEQIRWRFSF